MPQMAPKGAPAPAPAPGAPPQGAPQDGQNAMPKKSPTELIGDIHNDMLALSQILKQAGLPPEDLKQMDDVRSGFESLVDSLSKPQGQDGDQDQDQGPQGPMPEHGKGQPAPQY